jgi:hypothetical protein
VGLSASLPHTMRTALERDGVPPATATRIAQEPPVGSLFAAFLGYNPMETLVGKQTLATLPKDKAADITGRRFFPELISGPFIDGLRIAFTASLLMCLVAAWASWLRGAYYVAPEELPEDVPVAEEWVPA